MKVLAGNAADVALTAIDRFGNTAEGVMVNWAVPTSFLLFLAILKKGKENHPKKQGFFSPPKIRGKEGKNDQKSKEIPCKRKKQGNRKKKKGKED